LSRKISAPQGAVFNGGSMSLIAPPDSFEEMLFENKKSNELQETEHTRVELVFPPQRHQERSLARLVLQNLPDEQLYSD
jgi:hypothetical protein